VDRAQRLGRKGWTAAFRDAAVRSKEVDTVRLGSDFLALCVGLTTTGEDAQDRLSPVRAGGREIRGEGCRSEGREQAVHKPKTSSEK